MAGTSPAPVADHRPAAGAQVGSPALGTSRGREAGDKEVGEVAEFVRLEVDSGIGTIRLDRPPLNTLNTAVQEELRAAAAEAGDRADVRAVVLYGGPKVFAAGADVKEMVDMTYSDMAHRAMAISSALDAIARIPKVVVAAVTGYALGGGCELALTADFRVAGDNAKLGQPEILLGIIPGAGGTQRLPRLVGPARAKELVYSGRFVDADEALRIGLVDRVVAPDDVYSAAVGLAARYARGPAMALRAAKAAIDGGLDGDLASGLRLESHLFASLFATEDRAIGMRSFIENGPGKAEFVGR
jgi:enoyl-CoA hydratase/carnithine racemase